MTIECYSQRLLNPFRGVMNVIRYRSAEAVTTDGVHWEIYVSNDELRADLDPHIHVQTSDIRYGHWSAQVGLKRGPIYPSADFKRMEEMGAVVYEALLQYQAQVPFPLRDRYELWLLDCDELPLCLIHSAVFVEDIDHDLPLVWRAGHLCAESFRPTLAQPEQAAQRLMHNINILTGTPAIARWFYREEDGTAVTLDVTDTASDEGKRYAPEHFPDFFLRKHYADPALTELVEAFLQWQAPWLLLLQHLPTEVRYELEQYARQQAVVVEQHFRLYPTIVDQSFLRAARVEAMLRKAHGPREDKAERTMSTWYLELGDWSRGK